MNNKPKKGEDTAQSECNGWLDDFAENLKKAAYLLKQRDMEYPELGARYQLNLRANILEDLSGVIRKTIKI